MENGDKPAFSSTGLINNGEHPANCIGLTKREYFAAMAMQGILAGQKYHYEHEIADSAVYMADALLAKLDKTK